MCGIVGAAGELHYNDHNWIKESLLQLRHRGPDAAQIWKSECNHVILGHRRLSIIDVTENSNQPFTSDDGKLAIVFNGEIYNYRELREDLKLAGFRFQTDGDTEVLLQCYRRWGYSCLDYLNGMYSFAISDMRNGSDKGILFVARDRAGEKPLYYRNRHGKFEFSSELKGIPLRDGICLNGLNHYFATGYVPGEMCISSGVSKLPPATAGVYKLKEKSFSTWKYWQLPTGGKINPFGNFQETAEKAWELIKESTRLRLRSDVPIGIFLSGGLDSSLIAAAATEVSDSRVKTFTIGLTGSPLDETKFANQVAECLGTEHYVMNLEEPPYDTLAAIGAMTDEPIGDSSIIPTYLVSKLTKNHVTVALGGDGGDELFGGYQHYQNTLLDIKRLESVPGSLIKFIGTLAQSLPAGVRGRNRLASLTQGALQSRVWGTPFFDAALRRKLFHSDVVDSKNVNLLDPEMRLLGYLNNQKDPIENLTRQDFQQLLPDGYLVKVDRASMANSLEVRTPFLDHNLVDFAFSEIPSMWKCVINERRLIQNYLAKKYITKSFNVSRKQGFSIPMNKWITKFDLEFVMDTLPFDLLNKKFVERLIIGQSKGRTNSARLFALIMLAYSMQNLKLNTKHP